MFSCFFYTYLHIHLSIKYLYTPFPAQAKDTFETQLKNAMEELDVMHKRLDEEQAARNELKRSLKAASAELEEWQMKSTETRLLSFLATQSLIIFL